MEYQHINLSFLENFTRGDKKRMITYIRMFLKVGKEGMDSMQGHWDAKEWEKLKSAAHSLKPQVEYMGIDSVKTSIARIEEYAREQIHLDELPDLIRTVCTICTSSFYELENAVSDLEKG